MRTLAPLLGILVALTAAADPPVASLDVQLVQGTRRVPLDGIVLVPARGAVELIAEARDRMRLALATRPAWRAGPDGPRLSVHAITGVARLTAAARPVDAVQAIEVRDARQPRVRRTVHVWTPAPPPSGAPDALALYLDDGRQLRPIVRRALFARPGQTARLVVLGRYADGRWRAAAATLTTDAGRLTRRGPAQWTLTAGPVRGRPHRLTAAAGERRIAVSVRIVRY